MASLVKEGEMNRFFHGKIWTGEATKTIDPGNDPQKNQQRLQKGITKLLKNFPPPAK
jgi:hypothetical protein